MVEAYWDIGKSIVEQQDGYEKAEYGTRLIAELSKQMTIDFGKGFTPVSYTHLPPTFHKSAGEEFFLRIYGKQRRLS